MKRIAIVTGLLWIGCLFFSSLGLSPLMADEFNETVAENEAEAVEDGGDYMDTEEEEANIPEVQGEFSVEQVSQSVNGESRINPGNDELDIRKSNTVLKVYAQIADYLDEDRTLHWVLKTYGNSSYPSDEGAGREDDLLRIDEVLVDWLIGKWFISVGKRRVNWGTTSVWNPVNVVVPAKNPLVPDPQTEGHPLLLVNYANDLISFDLIYTRNFNRDWEADYDRWGARLSILLEDMEFGFYYFDGEPYDEAEIANILSTADYSRLVGISYSSNFLDDATLYLEIATFSENARYYYNEMGQAEAKDDPVVRGVIGSLITMDNNASIIVEGYHNGGGYSQDEQKNYYDMVDSTLPAIRNSQLYDDSTKELLKNLTLANYRIWAMNRNYLFVSYSKSFLEKYDGGLTAIAGEDGSSLISVRGSYSISDYYLLKASLNQYSGDVDSEFGNYFISNSATLTLSSSF